MMKKWFYFFLLALGLVLASIYVFIPKKIVLSAGAAAGCTQTASYRFLCDQTNWKKWWPGAVFPPNGKDSAQAALFVFEEDTFELRGTAPSLGNISIGTKGCLLQSLVHVLSLPNDSTLFHWQCELEGGYNPIQRIRQYQRARRLKPKLSSLLNSLCTFLTKKENVYGMQISTSSTTDTSLIATKVMLDHYPKTREIYDLINLLSAYASHEGARLTSYPMMNVTELGKNQYQLMVATPLDRLLPGKGPIIFKRLIRGKYEVAEVTGDQAAVREAERQMTLYFRDYEKVNMAIPFVYLVTDRSLEPDSSRWISRIYFPVF
jgi:hypothetical protein